MKTKFLCALLLTSFGFAQEPVIEEKKEIAQNFGYMSLGLGPLPIPLPVFGLGYQAQVNRHGVDVSLQALTVVVTTQVKANLLYHHYFKPSLASQFYVGGGVGPSILFGSDIKQKWHISTEFVFGKQYRNENNDLRFFQAQVSFPTFTWDDNRPATFLFPLLTLSYGIAF